jgi:hypothetical protein
MIRVTRSHTMAAALTAVLAVGPTAATAGQAKPAPPSPTVPKPQQAASDVKVTVKYAGKGAVDADHRLWVWLFDTPEISAGSIPIAEMSIEKNGGTASFPSVGAAQVYIAVAYDEKGGFVGQAPPPPGSPVAFYGAKGPNDPPMGVAPGPKGVVAVTLTDANRMQ